jgi:hypothetical protein
MATNERELGNLIGSDKVEGTAVYGADSKGIGSIGMIDKLSGKVSYAVLSFGGFLGIGDEYYPALAIPQARHSARRLSFERGVRQIKAAPRYADDSAWNWSDTAKVRSVTTIMASRSERRL